ncbi:MAG: adenylate kinase [Acidimicrobiales bacterium]
MIPGVKLVILGKQGAGKGTQAVRLCRHYVIPHISTGDIFRAAATAGTRIGLEAKKYMDAGELVPDDVVLGVIHERLEAPDAQERGFLLDGFPRNTAQAVDLEDMLDPRCLDAVIDLEIDTEVVLKRLAGRTVCQVCSTIYGAEQPPATLGVCDSCGGAVVQRADDTEGAIRRRLQLYEEQTEPLIEWYGDRGLLIPIDAVGAPEGVTDRIVTALDAHRRR